MMADKTYSACEKRCCIQNAFPAVFRPLEAVFVEPQIVLSKRVPVHLKWWQKLHPHLTLPMPTAAFERDAPRVLTICLCDSKGRNDVRQETIETNARVLVTVIFSLVVEELHGAHHELLPGSLELPSSIRQLVWWRCRHTLYGNSFCSIEPHLPRLVERTNPDDIMTFLTSAVQWKQGQSLTLYLIRLMKWIRLTLFIWYMLEDDITFQLTFNLTTPFNARDWME
jgi:hypothetical protein